MKGINPMKIKEGFVLRQVADATIVVPSGEASLDFNGMITLNDTGAFLWKLLEKGAEEQDLVSAMLAEYDVDEKTAAIGISRFIEKLGKEGLLD